MLNHTFEICIISDVYQPVKASATNRPDPDQWVTKVQRMVISENILSVKVKIYQSYIHLLNLQPYRLNRLNRSN